MRTVITLITLLFCWSACSDSNAIPKNVLPRDKMERVLWDIIQADQFSTHYLKKDSGLIDVKLQTMKLYDQVFLIHHITREEFQKSYNFYVDHPDVSKIMFDSLFARANREHSEIYRHQMKTPVPALRKLDPKAVP